MKGPTKKLLNSCTTEDRKQTTSGYSFRELSNATLSSISECEDIENFLIKRLKKDNPIVKLKCLRIIKYICEHGRDTFKINMQSKIGCLRSCTSYTGPLDPLYGDRDFKHVQATAKDVIKAVFVQSTNRRMPVKMESQQGGGFDGGSRSGGGFGGGPGGYSASGVYSRGYSPDRTSNSDSSIFSKIKSAVTEKATALANRSQSNDFRPKNYESRSSYRGPGGAAGSPAGGFGRSGFGSDDVRPRSEPTRPPPKSPSVRVDPFTRASTTRQPHLHRGRQKGKVGGVWGDAGDSGAQWGGADDSHERAYDRDSGSYDADSRGEPDSGSDPKEATRLGANHASPRNSFVQQMYGGGDKCDLTGKPRTINVVFRCQKHDLGSFDSVASITAVNEIETCQYEMYIATSLLCDHPAFAFEEQIPDLVACYPTRTDTTKE
eukprot:836519_1